MEKHRILIIDDDLNIHKDFQTILDKENDTPELDAMAAEFLGEKTTKPITKNEYDLDYATQGKEGVEKAQKALLDNKPFALSIVDMRMPPGWNGLETIEHLWEVDPDVQVVICSAYSDYSWEEIFEKTGSTDKLLILKKPFDLAEVAQLASALTVKWDLARRANIKMKEIEQIVSKRTIELAGANELLQTEIDERKKTEEALKISNQKILEQQKSVIEEERLKILLQVAGATAHELNQPLMSFIGNIELLKKDKNDPEKLEQNIAEVENLGKQISKIVGKIQNIHHEKPKFDPIESSVIDINQKLTILSVDDSDVDFAFIAALLKKSSNINLLRGTCIEDSIIALEKDKIDLIFLDYMLTDGTGLDFLRLIDKKGVETPVVVITAQGDEMIASQVIQAGAYDYIPKDRISVKVLSRVVSTAMEKYRLKKEINAAHKMMAKMSTTDDLTGLYNRRYFTEALEREMSRAKRHEECFALCIADIDHFKTVNDTYSHLAGDMVLIEMAKILKENLRSIDLVCRWGGEEFAIILPNTIPKQSVKACEKLRKVTAKKQFKYKNAQFSITISIGIASFNGQGSNSKELLSMADKALYQVKHEGRNNVAIWSNCQ